MSEVRGRGSSDPPLDYDVAVLGGGNAALCAALTAREAGRRVVVVERARESVGKELTVIVTSVLTTANGRMVFAHPVGVTT